MTYDYYYDSSAADAAASAVGAGVAILGIIYIVSIIASLAVSIVMIIAQWKIFTKAGKPGWAAIVPFYNNWVMVEVSGLPGWYFALLFLPVANIVATFMIYIEVAKKFGKSTGFGVASVFFPFVCLPILGFGKSSYQGFGPVQYQQPVQPQMMNQPQMQQQPMYQQPMNQPVQPAAQKSCPSCFAPMASDAQFCGNCGNKLN